MSYVDQYFDETKKIIDSLDLASIEKIIELLVKVREKNGRIFFIGVGGGAGNSTHAVNDFRKIAGIEAYTPVDNVSELTARVNDDGWESIFIEWLRVSKLNSNDMVFVFSVGGGCQEKMISINIIKALEYAKSVGAYISGVVGRDGGYTSQVADACVIIPVINPLTVTPHTEAFQAIVWHLLVSHPKICVNKMKWESLK
jgi:D-sedoheptulose 7-phosphate isomerase